MFFRRFLFSLIIVSGLLFVPAAFAADSNSPSSKTGETVTRVQLTNPIKGGETDIRVIVGKALQQVLTVVGSLTLVVFIIGGVNWLLSMGSSERVKKGTQTMMWAAVGLFIIFGSYGMVSMLIGGLTGKPVVDDSGASGGGGAPATTAVSYYVIGDAKATIWKEPKANVKDVGEIGAKVPCVEAIGGPENNYIKVKDPNTALNATPLTGWVKASEMTKMTDTSSCTGEKKAEAPKTYCETKTQYKNTHACVNTSGMSAADQKKYSCVSKQCQNSILIEQGKVKTTAEGNSWKCCVPPVCFVNGQCTEGGGACAGEAYGSLDECKKAHPST